MTNHLHLFELETILGRLIAITDENGVHMLDFADHPEIKKQVDRFIKKMKANICEKCPTWAPILQQELDFYFEGKSPNFCTPLFPKGTSFQLSVWEELRQIPAGQTCSYLEIATSLGRPTASRAVAMANHTNPIALLIPCHRVVYANGGLGGYKNGLKRKEWLLEHETRFFVAQ